MMPRFSIIVPLYNKAPYVKKALESILAQSYTNYEVVVVDDGSTDNSADIVRELVNGKWKLINDQFRLISQPNAGVAATRNNGVAASKGEYLCFLDADDWWEPRYLEEMDRLICDYPDAGLYGCDYFYAKNGSKKIFPKNVDGYIDYCKVYTQCGVMPVHPNGAIIPRKVFDEIGGFDPSIKMGEDFILFMQIVLKYKVAFFNKQLVTFNQDADPAWRAITKLHKPEYHMLFNLDKIESKVDTGQSLSIVNSESYKAMIDMLRVNGLMNYWLSDEYHDAAVAELEKVDWNKQPKAIVRQYKMPVAILKAKQSILHIGSYIKQKLLKIR